MIPGTSESKISTTLQGLSKVGYNGPLPNKIKSYILFPDFETEKSKVYFILKILIFLQIINAILFIILLFTT
jgi:hypothetical protein